MVFIQTLDQNLSHLFPGNIPAEYFVQQGARDVIHKYLVVPAGRCKICGSGCFGSAHVSNYIAGANWIRGIFNLNRA